MGTAGTCKRVAVSIMGEWTSNIMTTFSLHCEKSHTR